MGPRRKIAINTGGGDAPGLNAVVHAATLAAMGRGWDVVGIRHGYYQAVGGREDAIVYRLDLDAWGEARERALNAQRPRR